MITCSLSLLHRMPNGAISSWPCAISWFFYTKIKGTIFRCQYLEDISPASTIPGTRVTFQLKNRPTVTLTCQNCVFPQSPGCILTSILPFLQFLPFLPFSAERMHFFFTQHTHFFFFCAKRVVLTKRRSVMLCKNTNLTILGGRMFLKGAPPPQVTTK